MGKLVCPLCQQRRARRACPALARRICSVCCGTQRMTEINCPTDCTYLHSASMHPPAVVQRQQDRDVRFLRPLLQELTERQYQILFMVQAFLRTDRPNAPALIDNDVQQAAAALAETYETASRGIVYEHAATSTSGQRLAADIRDFLDAKQAEAIPIPDRDLAVVFRRLEAAARDAERAVTDRKATSDHSTAYLALLQRILKDPGTASGGDKTSDQRTKSGLIVPGR